MAGSATLTAEESTAAIVEARIAAIRARRLVRSERLDVRRLAARAAAHLSARRR